MCVWVRECERAGAWVCVWVRECERAGALACACMRLCARGSAHIRNGYVGLGVVEAVDANRNRMAAVPCRALRCCPVLSPAETVRYWVIHARQCAHSPVLCGTKSAVQMSAALR